MTFLTNLFGDGPLGTIIAAVIGLVILGLVVVVIYRLTVGRGLRAAPGGRARQPRLGIVDAFDLDRQRQLVLVRRDNVEHLIMIGGPNDLLIEPAIVRAQPSSGAEPLRREAAQPPLAPAANGGQERAAPRLQSYEQGRDAEKSYEEAARDFAPPREAPPVPPREAPVQRELPPQRDLPVQRDMPPPRDLPQRAPPLDAPLPREPATREPPPFAAPPRPPFGQPPGSEGTASSPSLRPLPPAARPVPPPPPPRSAPPPPRPAPPSRGPAAAPPPVQPGPPPEAPPARAPEQAPPPRLSVDIDSLEEEMAKLLGRPASEPKN